MVLHTLYLIISFQIVHTFTVSQRPWPSCYRLFSRLVEITREMAFSNLSGEFEKCPMHFHEYFWYKRHSVGKLQKKIKKKKCV